MIGGICNRPIQNPLAIITILEPPALATAKRELRQAPGVTAKRDGHPPRRPRANIFCSFSTAATGAWRLVKFSLFARLTCWHQLAD